MDIPFFYIFSQIVNALIIGLIYGLMAVGVTLVFSVMKMINFANGAMFMVGGYVVYYLCTFLGINPILALPITFAIVFAFGAIVQRALLRVMHTSKMERPSTYAIIATFGLSILLQNLALIFVGVYVKTIPEFMTGRITIFILNVSAGRLIAAFSGFLVLFILLLFIKKSYFGKALQATSQNRDGAAQLGINILQMDTFAFGLGVALSALGGALLAPIMFIFPDMGEVPGLKAFVIIILGGLGSIKGSIIGAIILGLVESLGSVFIPNGTAYRDVYGFIILIGVLLLRPQGLFGERARKV